MFRPGTQPSVDLPPPRPLVSATMSIRFQCGSCSQPIEVDDEWASKPVACPYCRKTVTAPMESTLGDPAAFQTAVPVTAIPPAAQPFSATLDAAQPHPAKNTIALVALFLAIGSMGMFLVSQSVLGAHGADVEELQRAVAGVKTPADQTRAYTEFLETHPGALQWLVPAMLLLMGGAVASLAAIVCGIIGSRRTARRGMAIAAMAISFVPILLCFSGLLA